MATYFFFVHQVPAGNENRVILRLRSKKVVQWGQDVVDNEFLGRRKSKKCCIFHKRRKFGESSSESEGYSSSSGGEADTPNRRDLRCQKECNRGVSSGGARDGEGQPSGRRRPFTHRLQEDSGILGGTGEATPTGHWDSIITADTAADIAPTIQVAPEQPRT
jgi:hypothetical protein